MAHGACNMLRMCLLDISTTNIFLFSFSHILLNSSLIRHTCSIVRICRSFGFNKHRTILPGKWSTGKPSSAEVSLPSTTTSGCGHGSVSQDMQPHCRCYRQRPVIATPLLPPLLNQADRISAGGQGTFEVTSVKIFLLVYKKYKFYGI